MPKTDNNTKMAKNAVKPRKMRSPSEWERAGSLGKPEAPERSRSSICVAAPPDATWHSSVPCVYLPGCLPAGQTFLPPASFKSFSQVFSTSSTTLLGMGM